MKSSHAIPERKAVPPAVVMFAAWAIGSCGVAEEPASSADHAGPQAKRYEAGWVTYDELRAQRNENLGDDAADGHVHIARLGAVAAAHHVTAAPGSPHARERDFLKGATYTATSCKVAFFPPGGFAHRSSTCDGKPHFHSYTADSRDGGTTTVRVRYVCHRADTCETRRKCAMDLLLEAARCVFNDPPTGSGLR